MRTGAENEPVLALVLSVALGPPLGSELVSTAVRAVSLRVVQREPGRGDEHGALGSGVGGGDGVVLLDHVGDHDHGRAVAEGLLDGGAGVGHLLDVLDLDVAVFAVAVAHDGLAFLADLLENVGAVGGDLEQPAGGGGSGVLRGEEEGENGHGDLEVGELAEDVLGLLLGRDSLAASNALTVAVTLHHLNDPAVHDTLSRRAGLLHADSGLGGARSEHLKNLVGSLLAVPGLGEGQDDGEVDELERSGDVVVIVGDLLDLGVRHVVTDESTAGDGAHELAQIVDELGAALVGANAALALPGVLGNIVESLKVLLVDLLLTGQVSSESGASEQAVETLAVLDVRLAVQEDPVLGAEELDGDVDDARLHVRGGVEDLTGHVAGGGDDDELVEDADAAQGSGQPFGVVFLEFGPDALEEWTDEGDLPGGADELALLAPVGELVVDDGGDKESGDNAKGAGLLGEGAEDAGVYGADGGLNGRGRDDARRGVERVHDGGHVVGMCVCVVRDRREKCPVFPQLR